MEFEDDVSLSPTSPVKNEDVKPEPDASNASSTEPANPADPGAASENATERVEDMDDDGLDLDTKNQGQRVMLVRLPEYLIAKLQENRDELSGADLGKVFIPQGTSTSGPNSSGNRMKLMLNSGIEALNPLPHRYDLNITNANAKNEYIMKEQEIRVAKGQGLENGYRKVKKTALVGHAVNECSLVADMNDPNYKYVLEQRKIMELPNAERQTTMLDSTAGVGGAKYGATLRQQKASWRRQVLKKQIAKNSTDGKAIRIPRNELLDILFRAFEETPYWTVRGLRERTRQPEVYLRSVLESIAILNKRGPYAMKYGLKEEYKALQSSGASVESMVQQAPSAPEGEDLDDDEDIEMEVVEIA